MKFFIIIDALDECPEAYQIRKRFFVEVRSSIPHIKLMVTSRHLASIESAFKQDTRLELRAQDQAVESSIESRIALRTELGDVLEGHDDVESIIVTTVLETTNGMSAKQ